MLYVDSVAGNLVALSDGRELQDVNVEHRRLRDTGGVELWTESLEAAESLRDISLGSEVSPNIALISLFALDTPEHEPITIRTVLARRESATTFVYGVEVIFELGRLNLVGYAYLLAKTAMSDPNTIVSRFSGSHSASFALEFTFRQQFDTLRQCEKHARDVSKGLVSKVRHSPDSRQAISLTFNFPPTVRSACEQYLLHFGEFLRDLGVDASVQIQEFGQDVLFAVVPHDRRDALENIRAALDVYLRIPDADLVGILVTPDDEMIMYKLRANVSHLQGQLELARAQNATLRKRIGLQRLAVELLSNTRVSSLPGESSERVDRLSSHEDVEQLTQYVSIAELERGPLRINLPQMIRDLKRFFRRDSGA